MSMTLVGKGSLGRLANKTGLPHNWVMRGKLRAIGQMHHKSHGGDYTKDQYVYRCECGNHIMMTYEKLNKLTRSQSCAAKEYRVPLKDACCGVLRKAGHGHRSECLPPGSRPMATPAQIAANGCTFKPFPPYADER